MAATVASASFNQFPEDNEKTSAKAQTSLAANEIFIDEMAISVTSGLANLNNDPRSDIPATQARSLVDTSAFKQLRVPFVSSSPRTKTDEENFAQQTLDFSQSPIHCQTQDEGSKQKEINFLKAQVRLNKVKLRFSKKLLFA